MKWYFWFTVHARTFDKPVDTFSLMQNHVFFFLGFLTSSSKIFTFELHLVRVQQSFNYLTILKWDGFGTRTLFRFFDFPTILTNHMALSTTIPMMFSSRETTFTNVAFQFFVDSLTEIFLSAFYFGLSYEKCALKFKLVLFFTFKSFHKWLIHWHQRLRTQRFHPWLLLSRF